MKKELYRCLDKLTDAIIFQAGEKPEVLVSVITCSLKSEQNTKHVTFITYLNRGIYEHLYFNVDSGELFIYDDYKGNNFIRNISRTQLDNIIENEYTSQKSELTGIGSFLRCSESPFPEIISPKGNRMFEVNKSLGDAILGQFLDKTPRKWDFTFND